MRLELGTSAIIVLVAAVTESPAQDLERALAVEREVQRLGTARVLWPGFDPTMVPLAIFTGEQTFLFRHPSPPEGFTPGGGIPAGVHVFAGRHPAVTANTSADIGGSSTATLLADRSRGSRSPTALAATAIHEAFHVFQRAHHPGWAANEGALFLYPAEDARLLALRRLETSALRRAVAGESGGAACWARWALEIRRQRFSSMDTAYSSYERLNELNEGLATYVQLLAAGETTVDIPIAGFPATEVRARTYTIGPALAFLLDRFNPGWKAALTTDDGQYLDAMLASAVAEESDGGATCAFTAAERTSVEQTAQRDAGAVLERRVELLRAFEARPGWRLVVQTAHGTPLLLQGFDPLNVERVEGGLLHTRLLQLGNDGGEIRVVDEAGADMESLTWGLGPHPLFNGVVRVVVAGVAQPQIESDGSWVRIRASGLEARFDNASVTVNGTEVIVHLERPKGASKSRP